MAKLQNREKVFLGGGVIALLLIVAYLLGQGPMAAYKKSAISLKNAKASLQEAQLWNAEIETARKKVEAFETTLKQQNFDLWTHIDGVVKASSLQSRADISSKRGAASPTENKVAAVELQLKGVNMKELVDLLHRVYANDYLILLDRLDFIKPAKDGKGLDCRMTFVSPKA